MYSKLIFFLVLVQCLFSCNGGNEKVNPVEKKIVLNAKFETPPNILWLVAEDLGPYIPSFGDSTVVTPNLSKLASDGICYDNFYTAHPVCAPARASIITGKYANRIAASHMRTGPWGSGKVDLESIKKYGKRMPDSVFPYEAMPSPGIKMFTEYLRAAGYYCTNNSKQDYQFIKTMTAWDENDGKAHWRNRQKDQPFFSVFNFGVTHESRIWAKSKDSLWIDKDLEIPIPPYLPSTEIAKNDVRRMYSNIKELDAQIGEVLMQLEEDGLMDNTVIFWYTDHGGPLPRQKRLLYDSGIKVPMIVQFPNKQHKGQRDERMISFIDLAPTILSLVNLKPPESIDGKAFLGTHIRSKEPQYVFGAADRFDEITDRIRSVRDNQFKYIKNFIPEQPFYLDLQYRNQMPIMQELLRLRDANLLTEDQALWFRNKKPIEELYDLFEDPHELNNLADNPKYLDKLLELRNACEEWVHEEEDTGLIPEPELLVKLWPNSKQPITDNPDVTIDGDKITIGCKTEGASLGYQIINENKIESTDKSWKIYTQPFVLKGNSKIKVKAHRIGYLPSAEILVTNN